MRQVSKSQLTKTTAIATTAITRIVTASSTLQKVSASSPVKEPVTSSSIIEVTPTSNEDSKTTGYPPTKTGNVMYTLFCCSGVSSMTRTNAFIKCFHQQSASAPKANDHNAIGKRKERAKIFWLSRDRQYNIRAVGRSLFQFITQNGKKTTPNTRLKRKH